MRVLPTASSPLLLGATVLPTAPRPDTSTRSSAALLAHPILIHQPITIIVLAIAHLLRRNANRPSRQQSRIISLLGPPSRILKLIEHHRIAKPISGRWMTSPPQFMPSTQIRFAIPIHVRELNRIEILGLIPPILVGPGRTLDTREFFTVPRIAKHFCVGPKAKVLSPISRHIARSQGQIIGGVISHPTTRLRFRFDGAFRLET